MRYIYILTISIYFLSISQAAQAAMTNHQIRSALAGKTVFLSTPVGAELPVRFHKSGSVSGRAGYLSKYLSKKKDVKSDRGRWWVASNRLCKKWRTWFNGRTYCFRLTKSGRNISWVRSDGKSGRGRISR